jgi:hypothetical protein
LKGQTDLSLEKEVIMELLNPATGVSGIVVPNLFSPGHHKALDCHVWWQKHEECILKWVRDWFI